MHWKASGFCIYGVMQESLERILLMENRKQWAVFPGFICVVTVLLHKCCLLMYENSLSFNAPGACFIPQFNPLYTATSKAFILGDF